MVRLLIDENLAGNCSTDRINHLIRRNAAIIADFVTLAEEAILIVNL
jgi:hypothetical protein